jgi:alcohol dehydrogenase class IV
MLNASMIAGMAFTNVSLGITHSMAHAVGGIFHLSHGLADAILLSHVIQFNRRHNEDAGKIYNSVAEEIGIGVEDMICSMNNRFGIPPVLSALIPDRDRFLSYLEVLSRQALADGCTKTNPAIPTIEQMKALFLAAYDNTRSA